jgi:hypothetical protein
MKAIFHPAAHEEMIESARFFEERSVGLGSFNRWSRRDDRVAVFNDTYAEGVE